MAVPAYGADIAEPPPIRDSQTLLYLRKIKDNWLNMPIVASAPNGARIGRFGDILVYNNSGIYEWYINVSPGPNVGTTWAQIGLSAAGNPAGSNTELQYNNGGVFGASPNLTWVSPALTVGLAGTATGQLNLAGSTSSQVTVQAANAAGGWTLTLPSTDGNSGEFLQTNGSGVTTWAAITPGGSDTQVQYNDGGTFGGDSGFLYGKTADHVSIGPQASLDASFSVNMDSTSVSYSKQTLSVRETVTNQNVNAIGLYDRFSVNYGSASFQNFPVGLYVDADVATGSTSDLHYALIGANVRAKNNSTAQTTTRLDALRLVVGDTSSSSTTTYGYGIFMKTGFSQALSNSQERVGIYLSDEKETDGNDTPGGKTGLYIHGHSSGTAQSSPALLVRNLFSNFSTDATQRYKESYNILATPTKVGGTNLPSTAALYADPISADGTGTLSTTGTAVTGSSTNFDNTGIGNALYNGNPAPGDYLVQTSTGYPRLITDTSGTTGATIFRKFPSNLSGASYTYAKPILRWDVLSGSHDFTASGRYIGGVINAIGYVGIGTLQPGACLDIYPHFKVGDETDTETPALLSEGATVLLAEGTALSDWRQNRFVAPTLYGKLGSAQETVSSAATVQISNSPQVPEDGSIAIQKTWALEIDSGAVLVGGPTHFQPSALQGVNSNGYTIRADATMAILDPSGGNYTLNSAPTIADSLVTGQILYITVGDTQVNTVTLQDQDTLPGSNLQLGAATRTIGAHDVLTLLYTGTDWSEVSYANN